MTDRINLVDAYSNRSVIAKLASMEDRIAAAEGVEKTAEDAVKKIESLVDGIGDTVAKADAAAKTAAEASAKADEASSKASAASATIEKSVAKAETAAETAETASAAATEKAGKAETSAESAAASAAAVSGYADAAKASATAASVSADEAKKAAASVSPETLVDLTSTQTVIGQKTMQNTGNRIRVANAELPTLNEADVLNSHDINAVNGACNDLVHRSGDALETVKGKKSFPIFHEIQGFKSDYPMTLKESSADQDESDVSLSLVSGLMGSSVARILLAIKTPIGDATAEIVLRASYDGSYLRYETVKNEVTSNNLIASIEGLITVRTYSIPSADMPEIRLQIRYTGDSLKNIPCALGMRVSTVTPGDISSTHYDWSILIAGQPIPSSAVASEDYLVIPVSGYTETSAVSAVSDTVEIDGKKVSKSQLRQLLSL